MNRHGRKDGHCRSVVEGGIGDRRFHPVDHAGQASVIGKNVQWLKIAVTDHRILRRRAMSVEPVNDRTKSVEAKFFYRGALAGEISIEGKILAGDACPLDPIDEIFHRQSLQTRLRLVPKPDHLATNARDLPNHIHCLPEPFDTQAFKLRSERTSGHAFHDYEGTAQRLNARFGDKNTWRGITQFCQRVLHSSLAWCALRINVCLKESKHERTGERLRRVLQTEAENRGVIAAAHSRRRLGIGQGRASDRGPQVIQQSADYVFVGHGARH